MDLPPKGEAAEQVPVEVVVARGTDAAVGLPPPGGVTASGVAAPPPLEGVYVAGVTSAPSATTATRRDGPEAAYGRSGSRQALQEVPLQSLGQP